MVPFNNIFYSFSNQILDYILIVLLFYYQVGEMRYIVVGN